MKNVAGYTHEGYAVADEGLADLSFCLFAAAWEGFSPSLSAAIEFNKTSKGKRRPYVTVRLFGVHIQVGWLF